MAKPVRIHIDKNPPRLHYIAEWAKKRKKKPKDFVETLGIDKGTVSRWFAGRMPAADRLPEIAAFLSLDDVESLFRDPKDDWLARLFKKRSDAERDEIHALLEIHFREKIAKD